MSLLEDRILRIIELRQCNYDAQEIGRELQIGASLVTQLEDITKQTIEEAARKYSMRNINRISYETKLSIIALKLIAAHYNIPLREGCAKRPPSPKQEHIEKIKQLISQGIISLDDLVDKTGLSPITINRYAKQTGIERPWIKWIKNRGEKTKEAIKLAIQRGMTSIDDIAREVNLAHSTVYHYVRVGKLLPPSETYSRSKQTKQKIVEAIQRGMTSIDDIAREVDKSPHTVYRYVQRGNLLPEREERQKKKEQRKKMFLEAIEAGAPSIRAAAEKTGISYQTALRYADELGVKVQKPLSEKHKAIIELAKEGFSLGELAEAARLSCQGIDQILRKYGVHATWKEARVTKKEEQQKEKLGLERAREDLVNILHARIAQLEAQAPWAHRMAYKYLFSKSKTSYSNDKLTDLFEAYETAQQQGIKLSLYELGDISRIHFVGVGCILREVGLEPMYGSKKRKYISPPVKHAIKRAWNIPLSATDVGYFLNIHPSSVAQKFTQIGRTRQLHPPIFNDSRRGCLTYRKASEIYEALDAGFKKSELLELLDTSPRIVQRAIELKKKLGPVLISTLQYLHSNPTITTPYYHPTQSQAVE